MFGAAGQSTAGGKAAAELAHSKATAEPAQAIVEQPQFKLSTKGSGGVWKTRKRRRGPQIPPKSLK